MAETPDEWLPVSSMDAEWQPVRQPPIEAGEGSVGRVLSAFGHGFGEGYGQERLGLSDESWKWMQDAGMFRREGERYNPFKAFNEVLFNTVVATPELAIRGLSGLFRGAQDVAFTGLQELGASRSFARDVAAMPEAFFGSPHPTGTPKPRGEPVRPGEIAEKPPTAKPDVYEITDYLGADKDTDRMKVQILRDKDGVPEAIISDVGIQKIAPAYRDLPPEQMIAETLGSHPPGTPADPSTVRPLTEPPAPIPLAEARDLGVVGPERPSISEGKPEEAARRTVAAERPDEKVTGEVGEGPTPWRERFEHFVGKIKTGEDAKQLIRDAADESGEFPIARAGDIVLKDADAERLAEAAGVDPATVDRNGVGRLLHNDNRVRVAMQAMLQATEDVKSAARDVKLEASETNLIKLQEAMLRRDTWVEQVVGHRAEWGRTGNVFQEFLERTKEEEGFSGFLRDQGRDTRGLRKIADAVDALDRGQAARFLSDANKPTFWDKFMWYWVNALISGPVTHTKYVIANAAFAGYESAVVTPIAGALGVARRAVTGGREGVYVGEAAARVWGIVAGTPDAIVAAAKAARTGLQTPLPGEVAQGIIPKRNKNIAFQQQPIPGWLGTAIGIPSKGASAIHTFFNFLGYRASIEAQSYRAAAKEGLRPNDQAFWDARQRIVNAPTKEVMDAAIDEGYRLTYIQELGPGGKALTNFVMKFKPARLILPFTHIPFNVMARGVENSPLAFLSKEARDDLLGRNGAVKQDMAGARLIAGSAVGAMMVNWVANDTITGFGPTDQKERAQWLATNHQPYSVKIGGAWYSFNRFGSIGTMLGIYANLAEAMPHMKPDGEELTKALTMTVHATGRLLEDEVGMQGLAGLIEAINEPERKGARAVSSFAGSFLPFSSFLRQTASTMDPSMREAKTVVDGLRYYIPGMREALLPKRDFQGQPVANAGYYGGSYLGPVIQHRDATVDRIAAEMKALDLHPAPPKNVIGGVQLTPRLYDQYQQISGAYIHSLLGSWVQQPGWDNMPAFARHEVFQKSITAAHQAAAAQMQAMYPALIEQGVDNRIRTINGQKPVKKMKETAE